MNRALRNHRAPTIGAELLKALRDQVLTIRELREALGGIDPTYLRRWVTEWQRQGIIVSLGRRRGRPGGPPEQFTLSPDWYAPHPPKNG